MDLFRNASPFRALLAPHCFEDSVMLCLGQLLLTNLAIHHVVSQTYRDQDGTKSKIGPSHADQHAA